MRPIWTGAISFGLINIPVALYAAAARDELKFRLLRAGDLSPVNYKRVAQADGKEVPWDQIVKGYEYEKGKFVVLKEEDFKRVDVEATQTVDIINFVKLEEINPLLFSKPYYMQSEKGGDKAYGLLRDSLTDSRKVGIAKVVIKERQHLAAIKAQQNGLMLELMRFPDEVIEAGDFKAAQSRTASKAEMAMASKLIQSMTTKWEPGNYHDDYKKGLEKVIEQKIASGGDELPAPCKPKKATPALDLVSVLQQSIRKTQETGNGKRGGKAQLSKSRVHLN